MARGVEGVQAARPNPVVGGGAPVGRDGGQAGVGGMAPPPSVGGAAADAIAKLLPLLLERADQVVTQS